MATDTVTLELPRDYVGQLADGLEALIREWDDTAEYLDHGQVKVDAVIRECRDSREARSIAAYYRSILARISQQMSMLE